MHAPSPSAPAPVAELYRAHGAFLRLFLMRRGFDDASAEDLVHEVFITAERIGGYSPGPASPRTWLCAIAIRLGANASRLYEKRRARHIELALERVSGPNELAPDWLLSRRLQAERIEGALAALTPIQHRCLLDFYLTGRTCEEIAREENIPVGTVYSRLHAARRAFMDFYEMATSKGLRTGG